GRVAIWIVGGLFLSILGQVVGWGGFLAGMFRCNWKQGVRYAGIAGLAGMIFAGFMGDGPFPQPGHLASKSDWGGSTAWWLVGVTLCWWGLALLFAIPSHLYWRRKRTAANPLAAMGEYQRTRVFPSMDGTVGRREPTLDRQKLLLDRQELTL